jgi:hypothetical protein
MSVLFDHIAADVTGVLKLRRMRWAEHVIFMGKKINAQKFSWGILKERDHMEDLGIGGRII